MAVAVTEESSDLNIASACTKIKGAPPTAVNLSWTVDRMFEAIDSLSLAASARVAMILTEKISQEYLERNIKIGRNGVAFNLEEIELIQSYKIALQTVIFV